MISYANADGLRIPSIGRLIVLAAMAMLGLLAALEPALAQQALPPTGQPLPWQTGLQAPATEVAEEIKWFYNAVNVVIILITLFVLGLLVYVMVRFRESANPRPTRTSHNTLLEVLWTAIPVVVLVGISIFSFPLLFLQYSFPRPDLTVKAIGNTWFWVHEYPDHGNIRVTSNMLTDEQVLKQKLGAEEYKKRYDGLKGMALQQRLYADAKPVWVERKQPRILAVDNEVVVPVNKVVHVLVTSNDVIHAWTINAFGSKVDAVPGRITATWFKAKREGVFYGQCSELCGRDHAFMPIAVRVVKQDVFEAWTAAIKARDPRKAREIIEKASADGPSGTSLAAAGGQRR